MANEYNKNSNNVSSKFICGVVEGFYGTPWKVSEREDLYTKLKKYGMGFYIYAPKDDAKHRKKWRKKYHSFEKKTLKNLIDSAKINNIEFVYAISPGINIVYSSPKDIKHLKVKLGQVYDLGCRSFALLFDDIDPDLCLVDKMEFSSPAEAQVRVSNDVYTTFKDLKYLFFCPTEYSTNRAKPNLESSEYLKTLGNKLHEKIHILWTGGKVIPKEISSSEIRSVSSILKRKPVIWENIHANDYERSRLFLGPFKGRPVSLAKEVAGILTNPNCEYECNFVPIHTLGSWLKAVQNVSGNESNEQNTCKNKTCDGEQMYDSDLALQKAVEDWLLEITTMKKLFQKNLRNLNLDLSVLANDMNSLVSESSTCSNEVSDSESDDDIDDGIIDSKKENDEKVDENQNETLSKENDIATQKDDELVDSEKKSGITYDDVLLLCKMFHLPYEYGESVDLLLCEFKWLKENGINDTESPSQIHINTWMNRSLAFQDMCKKIETMFDHFIEIPNRCLLQQLYPYIYDVKETANRASHYIRYLGSKDREKGEHFLPSNPEPYQYQAGIIHDLQALLPSLEELQGKPRKEHVKDNVYLIRPYLSSDKERLYSICNELSDERSNQHALLQGDIYLGPFLEYPPTTVFVLVVNDVVAGYIAAHEDAGKLNENVQSKWLPQLQSRYSLSSEDLLNRLQYNWSEELMGNSVFSFKVESKYLGASLFQTLFKCIHATTQKEIFTVLPKTLSEKVGDILTKNGFKLYAGDKEDKRPVIYLHERIS